MKNLILCFLAVSVLAVVVGCSDSSTSTTASTQSTALAPDTKDIKK